MTNDKLPSGVYTCLFERFAGTNLTPPIIADETLITKVYGDSHYNVVTFSHQKINNQYTKAYIQFSSDGQPGEITLEMRYYGSRFNKFLVFCFYSRVIAGKQNTHFNHDILSVTSQDDNREVLYFENVNMNSNKINILGDPQNDLDAANKKYVDNAITSYVDSAIADKTSKSYVDSENSQQDTAIADKASKSYVDSKIAKLPGPQNVVLLDGSKAMT